MQWVGCGGISDHCPIFLELKGRTTKPPSPFKFHLGWLLDESYLKLITTLWVPYNVRVHGHAAVHFMENLKKIKGATKDWAKEKRARDEKEFLDVEYHLQSLMKYGDGGFSSKECKEVLLGLEKHRWVLLGEKEEMWRLKSRAIWLKGGDENTKFFQAYARGRRMGNTIWELRKEEGTVVSSFDGLSAMGVEHFQSLYCAQEESSIAKIVKIASLFPCFVEEADNRMLMEEVSEEELGTVLHSFQKDKLPGPDG